MFEFVNPGTVATTKGLFIGIPNLPGSFTEDYTTSQGVPYKTGRFILSLLTQLSTIIKPTDFLNNPDEFNKLGVTLEIISVPVTAQIEDRYCNVSLVKIIDLETNQLIPLDIGEPLDDSFPTGKFTILQAFPQAQLINIGDSTSYSGAIIAESVLLQNGLESLTLSIDGTDFLEAFLKGIYKTVASQTGELQSTILPYQKPQMRLTTNNLNTVNTLFDGIDAINNNLFYSFATITYRLGLRMSRTLDRATVEAV